MNILVFGANSDIAKCVIEKLENKNFNITKIQRSDINFNDLNSSEKIFELLENSSPDAILNFAGVLGDNSDDYEFVFDPNFKSNWDIIRFYVKNTAKNPIKFLMIGSSSYSSGRRGYMLYSASKAALYNLFLSACSFFEKSNFVIGLINLPRVKTKMISHLLSSESDYMEIEESSNYIVDFLLNLRFNASMDLGVK